MPISLRLHGGEGSFIEPVHLQIVIFMQPARAFPCNDHRVSTLTIIRAPTDYARYYIRFQCLVPIDL